MTHSAPRRYCLYPSNLLWHWCDLDRLRSCDKRDLGPEIQAPNSQDLWFQQVELPPCPILDSSVVRSLIFTWSNLSRISHFNSEGMIIRLNKLGLSASQLLTSRSGLEIT